MAKNIPARIVHKNDLQTNWANATGIPELGELIIYRADSNYSLPRLKIGDGTNNPTKLPFLGIVQSGGDFNIDNNGVVTINIDYSALAFDTTEIVVNSNTNTNTSTTSVLGQAVLGQMILA